MSKIIFVHGMNANAKSWNGVDKHADIIDNWPDTKAIELDGHNEPVFNGEGPPDPYTLLGCASFMGSLLIPPKANPSMNDYIASVVAKFPAASKKPPSKEDVCLIGHSMGGAVISHVAAQHPDRIGLMIFISAMVPSEGETIHDLAKIITKTGPVPPNAICAEFGPFLPDISESLVLQSSVPKSKKFKSNTRFESIKKHYVQCSADKIIPTDAQEAMLKNYPLIVRHVLPTGHLPQYQDPENLVKLLAEILSTW